MRRSGQITEIGHCFLGLQDLHRINALFPELKNSASLIEIYNALVFEIERYQNNPKLTEVFGIYKHPSLLDEESPYLISFLLVLTISQCFGADKIHDSNNENVFKSRISGLALFLPQNIKDLVNKIIELKLFYCHVPTFDINETTPYSRNIEIVSKYWDILRDIVTFQSQASLGFTPHPLTRYINSLRERIVGNLSFDNNTNESIKTFISNVDTFTACLLGGDVDEFSIDEWTNGIIAENQNLLEKLKMQYGIGICELTEPEDVFIQVINHSIRSWEKMVNDQMDQLINKVKKTNNFNSNSK